MSASLIPIGPPVFGVIIGFEIGASFDILMSEVYGIAIDMSRRKCSLAPLPGLRLNLSRNSTGLPR
jgi:hypothetical protein